MKVNRAIMLKNEEEMQELKEVLRNKGYIPPSWNFSEQEIIFIEKNGCQYLELKYEEYTMENIHEKFKQKWNEEIVFYTLDEIKLWEVLEK